MQHYKATILQLKKRKKITKGSGNYLDPIEILIWAFRLINHSLICISLISDPERLFIYLWPLSLFENVYLGLCPNFTGLLLLLFFLIFSFMNSLYILILTPFRFDVSFLIFFSFLFPLLKKAYPKKYWKY